MIAGKLWTMQPLPHTVGGNTYKGGFRFLIPKEMVMYNI